MSSCANGGRNVPRSPEGYPTLKLRVEFSEGNPWTYPIALNGRSVTGVYADGVRLAPARDRDWDAECEVD